MAMSHVARKIHVVWRWILFVYNKTHWFTDKEAWGLFKLAAFGEAVGWTLLIGAIVYRHLGLPGAEITVGLAGRLHGGLFMLYFVFVLVTARSMQWGVYRITGALLAGMPPYTSVLYEQLMSYHRKKFPKLVAPPADIE
jgi:integral membrane protein